MSQISVSSGGGIASINADTSAAQVIAVGTTGNDVAVATSSGTTTISVPSASATARGVVTTGAQTLAGVKTLSSAPILSSLTASTVPYIDSSKAVASFVPVYIEMYGGNGYGSGSYSRRFTTVGTSSGPATVVDDATAGTTITIGTGGGGLYVISRTDGSSTAVQSVGLTVNASNTNTPVYNLTRANGSFGYEDTNGAVGVGVVTRVIRLADGDVVRPQDGTKTNPLTDTNYVQFTMAKVGP